MDRAPLNSLAIVLEKGERGLVLTTDESKILGLANLKDGVRGEVVVAGAWDSADPVNVHIESALVKFGKVSEVREKLFQEDPRFLWFPIYEEDEDTGEYSGNGRDDCIPWIVWPHTERGLDKDDPIGSIEVMSRPRIAQTFSSALSLRRGDPFGRIWKNEQGQIIARSFVWGREMHENHYGRPVKGKSLVCSRPLLEDLLSGNGVDLLIRIKLGTSEKKFARGSRQTYTYGAPRSYQSDS